MSKNEVIHLVTFQAKLRDDLSYSPVRSEILRAFMTHEEAYNYMNKVGLRQTKAIIHDSSDFGKESVTIFAKGGDLIETYRILEIPLGEEEESNEQD